MPYYLIHIGFKIFNWILCACLPLSLNNSMDIKSLLIVPLFPRALADFNSPTWFVPVLFYIEILYFLMQKILPGKWRRLGIALFCAAGLAGVALSGNITNDWTKQHICMATWLKVAVLMPFFPFGIIYRNILENKNGKIQLWISFGGILILDYLFPSLCGKGTVIEYKALRFANPLCTYFAGILGILLWVNISKRISTAVGESKIIEYIGRNTYSIMAYHFFGFFIINILLLTIYPTAYGDFLKAPRSALFGENIALQWIYIIGSIAVSLLMKYIIDTLGKNLIK